MHTVTTAEQKTWTLRHLEKSEGFTERSCRSAVCGGDVFIPDTEYDGASLDFSCDVNHT